MPAALQSALVMAVLTLASFPVMLRDRVRAKASRRAWAGVAWLGVSDALNIVLFFEAYRRTTVALAVLTHCMTPIFVALAAPVLLGERLRARTFLAVAVAFTGLTLLLQPWREGFSSADVVGASCGAASAIFYASNVIVNKRLAREFSGSEMMFFHGLVSVPLLFALVPRAAYAEVTASSLAYLTVGALGPGATAGLLFVWGLRRVDASHASVLSLLEPFVAVLLAALVLGQTLGPVAIFGGILIAAGALIITSRGAATPDSSLRG